MTKHTLASIAVLGLLAATSFTALADERDKKTVITTKESLMVPGKVLPPGTYVMKLLESPNRNIVTIFNEKQDELQTMFIAFPNYKVNRTGDVTLTYWETPAGSPRALRAWFWPGDNFGQEFAYPKQMAETLARENNNAKIASYETLNDTSLSQAQLAEVKVADIPEPAPAIDKPSPVYSASTPAPTVAVTTPQVTQPVRDTANDTLLAQNTPAPSPVFNDNSPAVVTTPTELPQTASPLSWVMLAGLVSFAAAIAVRQLRA